jgi:hypothetical protein
MRSILSEKEAESRKTSVKCEKLSRNYYYTLVIPTNTGEKSRI